jgi:hypothetical protein
MQPDLFGISAPVPYCPACESPLIEAQHQNQHIQPAYVCCTPNCSQYGKCQTCLMLMDWFATVDA